MGASRLNIGSSSDSLGRAVAALQAADAELTERIPEEMRLLARRLADVARSRVLEEPVHGKKQRGLRAELSAGVGVDDTPDGATITTSMPVPNERALPRDTDDPVRGWRHPVFGNRTKWVHESFGFSWFMDSVASLEAWDDGMNSLQDLLDEVAQQVADRTAA